MRGNRPISPRVAAPGRKYDPAERPPTIVEALAKEPTAPAITLDPASVRLALEGSRAVANINADAYAAISKTVSEAGTLKLVDFSGIRAAAMAIQPIGISETQRAVLRDALATVDAHSAVTAISRETAARVAETLTDLNVTNFTRVREAVATLGLPRVEPGLIEALRRATPVATQTLTPRVVAAVQEATALAELPSVSEAVDSPIDQQLHEISAADARELAAHLVDLVAFFMLTAAVLTENRQLDVAGTLLGAAAVLMRVYWLLSRPRAS